jgi:hypothetical protein
VTNEQEMAVYRLLPVPGLGPGALGRVLAAWREQPELVAGFWGRPVDEYRARWGVSPRAARCLHGEAAEQETLAAEADAARAIRVEMMSVMDAGFAALAADRGLPPVLFTRGNQDLLWEAGVAIPHSRGAPEEALGWAADLASALAEAGVGLVSGHNRDGYRRAAAAAKRAGAPLVIVLDRPLHGEPATGPRAEPVVTARLWDSQFRPERELVLSSIGPREAWMPTHARRRDELVTGLADVVVAGAVRPGGIMAALGERRVMAHKPIFRSPFCGADLPAPLLPTDITAAAARVIEAVQEPSETGGPSGARSRCPQPGWLDRCWASEIAAFVSLLEGMVGRDGWVERRPAGPVPAEDDPAAPGRPWTDVLAVVMLPLRGENPDSEMVVLRRFRRPAGRCGLKEPALLLTPGASLSELEAFRAYLTRCRSLVQAAIRTPPTSASRAPDRYPIRDLPPSPE